MKIELRKILKIWIYHAESCFLQINGIKKRGHRVRFWRKRQFTSLNSSVFIENLPSFERARAHARANHAKIDAQEGCAMQLNGITLKETVTVKLSIVILHHWKFPH